MIKPKVRNDSHKEMQEAMKAASKKKVTQINIQLTVDRRKKLHNYVHALSINNREWLASVIDALPDYQISHHVI